MCWVPRAARSLTRTTSLIWAKMEAGWSSPEQERGSFSLIGKCIWPCILYSHQRQQLCPLIILLYTYPPMTTVATLVVLLLSLLIGTLDVGATHSKCRKTSQPSSGKWSLLWRDEFSGSKIDGSKWSYQLGDGSEYGIPGWGNGESQRYTDSRRNAYVSGGRLILKAVARGNDITSARLRTIGKFDVRPGYKGFNTIRVSVRVKVPGAGPGMWGAAWMVGADLDLDLDLDLDRRASARPDALTLTRSLELELARSSASVDEKLDVFGVRTVRGVGRERGD